MLGNLLIVTRLRSFTTLPTFFVSCCDTKERERDRKGERDKEGERGRVRENGRDKDRESGYLEVDQDDVCSSLPFVLEMEHS